MKKNLLTFLLVIVLTASLSTVLVPAPIQASEDFTKDLERNLEPIGDVFGGRVGRDTLPESIASIVKIVLGLLGIIFLVLIIYGGFMWMTAAGNEEQIGKAKKLLVAACIGAAIVLGSYAITYFVMDLLVTATTGETINI